IIYEQVGEPIETDFDTARAITLDDAGNIVIAGDSKLVKYDPAGKPLDEIELPKEPTCLEFDLNGNLIVGMSNVIMILDPQGETVRWHEQCHHDPGSAGRNRSAMDRTDRGVFADIHRG
ncbi:MAG: hypothetical protein ACYSO1_01590, partial [Planctomycetota bacterium]